MAASAFAVILAGIKTAQCIIHKIIQALLNIPGITEYLNSRLGEFLLSTHTHAPSDNMGYLIFQYLIHRYTPASAMHGGVWYNSGAGYLLLIFIYIR